MALHNPGRRRLVERDTSMTIAPTTVSPTKTSDRERRGRKARRPQELLDAVMALDTTSDPTTQRELLQWIRDQYEQRHGGTLLGLFAHCYLGAPYIDHRMDITGTIVEHYAPGDHVPPPFANARPLASSTAYLFIEIYDDGQIVPVRQDGSSAV